MSAIPVTFDHEGKEYKGELTKVAGAGGVGMYHLYVDRFYWGQLSYNYENPGINGLHGVAEGWRFNSNTKDLQYQAEYFGRVIMAAMEVE